MDINIALQTYCVICSNVHRHAAYCTTQNEKLFDVVECIQQFDFYSCHWPNHHSHTHTHTVTVSYWSGKLDPCATSVASSDESSTCFHIRASYQSIFRPKQWFISSEHRQRYIREKQISVATLKRIFSGYRGRGCCCFCYFLCASFRWKRKNAVDVEYKLTVQVHVEWNKLYNVTRVFILYIFCLYFIRKNLLFHDDPIKSQCNVLFVRTLL